MILSWKQNEDTVRFAMILALISSSYKAILCSLRKIGFSDKTAAPLAGFLSALWAHFETKWRRNLYAVLLLSKAIDSVLNIITEKSELVREQDWVTRDHLMFAFCAISFSHGQYCGFFEQHLLNRSYMKLLFRWSQMTKNEWSKSQQFYAKNGIVPTIAP